ncbi:MAG: hypothetical protein ACM37W_10555 [Actinomycetota bacterium]
MPYPNFSGSESQHSVPTSSPTASRWLLKVGAQLVALSLLTALLPAPPASALRFSRNRDSYRLCARELLAAGITSEAASAACGAALHPADISQCVTRINQKAEIPATDALLSCRRVRRPDELANCVVNIRTKSQTEAAAPLSVMDFCRRSLLPERFADCVVGLSNHIKFPTERLMATCIDARNEVGQIEPLTPSLPVPNSLPIAPPSSAPIQTLPTPVPAPAPTSAPIP